MHTLFKKIHRMHLTRTFFLIGNLFTILSTVSLKCHSSERWLLPGEIYFQIESQHVHAEKRLFWISKLEGIQGRESEVIRICRGWFRMKNYEAKICTGELNKQQLLAGRDGKGGVAATSKPTRTVSMHGQSGNREGRMENEMVGKPFQQGHTHFQTAYLCQVLWKIASLTQSLPSSSHYSHFKGRDLRFWEIRKLK